VREGERERGREGEDAPPILRDKKADGRFWLMVRGAAEGGSRQARGLLSGVGLAAV